MGSQSIVGLCRSFSDHCRLVFRQVSRRVLETAFSEAAVGNGAFDGEEENVEIADQRDNE